MHRTAVYAAAGADALTMARERELLSHRALTFFFHWPEEVQGRVERSLQGSYVVKKLGGA